MSASPSAEQTSPLLLLPLLSRFLTADPAAQPHLTKTQVLVLTILSAYESIHMSQLASILSCSKEQTTRACAPLVEAGLVMRFAQPENRTKVFLRLTPEGHALSQMLRAQFSARLRACAQSALNDEEFTQLQESAETLLRLLSKLL